MVINEYYYQDKAMKVLPSLIKEAMQAYEQAPKEMRLRGGRVKDDVNMVKSDPELAYALDRVYHKDCNSITGLDIACPIYGRSYDEWYYGDPKVVWRGSKKAYGIYKHHRDNILKLMSLGLVEWEVNVYQGDIVNSFFLTERGKEVYRAIEPQIKEIVGAEHRDVILAWKEKKRWGYYMVNGNRDKNNSEHLGAVNSSVSDSKNKDHSKSIEETDGVRKNGCGCSMLRSDNCYTD